MTLNKDYIIQNKKLIDLLNDIDSVVLNLSKFKNGKYKYKIKIYKNKNELWDAEINVNNEKQNNFKTFKDVANTSSLF